MKAEQAYGPDGHKRDSEKRKLRLSKKHAEGPIGFGQVLGMVRRDGRKGKNNGEDGALLEAAARHSGLGFDLTGAVPSALALDAQTVANLGVDPNALDAASLANVADARELTQMHPAEAMQTIVDEARRMKLVADTRRELRIELEPAHLGPIVIRLMIDKNQIRTELSAREERAAAALAQGTEALRDKLAALGFASAEVVTRHNPDDFE
jgi:hypothetical protein